MITMSESMAMNKILLPMRKVIMGSKFIYIFFRGYDRYDKNNMITSG
eukprot:Gb_16299 [translate_table: standard]